MTCTDYLDCTAADAPAFTRLAERLESGEDPFAAVDHMSLQQINHAARIIAGNRPLCPWIENVGNDAAAVAVRSLP